MSTPRMASTALSGTAFATLLLIALMMGANHVAARNVRHMRLAEERHQMMFAH